jgi:hypothetical protein
MLTFCKANMAHAYTVLADLSPVSTEEVNAECGNWWAAMPKVQSLLELPDSQTEALIDEKGKALAIFGHYPSTKPLRRTTWFVFSKGFQERGFAAARACRRRVEVLEQHYPRTNFHSITRSNHSDRDRWFRLLGFVCGGVTPEGAHFYVRLLPDKRRDPEPAGRYNPDHPRAS